MRRWRRRCRAERFFGRLFGGFGSIFLSFGRVFGKVLWGGLLGWRILEVCFFFSVCFGRENLQPMGLRFSSCMLGMLNKAMNLL